MGDTESQASSRPTESEFSFSYDSSVICMYAHQSLRGISLEHGWQIFLGKDERVNILSFTGHRVSATSLPSLHKSICRLMVAVCQWNLTYKNRQWTGFGSERVFMCVVNVISPFMVPVSVVLGLDWWHFGSGGEQTTLWETFPAVIFSCNIKLFYYLFMVFF